MFQNTGTNSCNLQSRQQTSTVLFQLPTANELFELNASGVQARPGTQSHLVSSPTEVCSAASIRGVDTEAGMLSGISQERSIRSNPYWFTEFCNSQCLSHFAAPFIVVRAETSVAESCTKTLARTTTHEFMRFKVPKSKGTRQQGTITEDGPFSACCPRVSARGHRFDLHPRPDPHRRLCTVNQVDACE